MTDSPKETLSYIEGVGRIEDAFLEIFNLSPSDPNNIKVRRLAETCYTVIMGDIGSGYAVPEPDYVSMTNLISRLSESHEYAKGNWRVDAAWDRGGVANLYSKNLIHFMSERPGYCDRGRYKVLVEPRRDTPPHDATKVTIQGLSHYYFSKRVAMTESELWAVAAGQFVYDANVEEEERTLTPITMSHQEEIEKLPSEKIGNWEVAPSAPVLVAPFKYGIHRIVPFQHEDNRFVWRWIWGVDVLEDMTPKFCIDESDWFPRAYMSLENALTEVAKFNSFRKCGIEQTVTA